MKPSQSSETSTAKKRATLKSACDEEALTSQNLRILKAILDNPGNPEESKTQLRRPRAPSKTKTKTKPNNVSQSSSSSNDVRPLRFYAQTPTSSVEQRKLATTTFNSSLKVLSALAKQRQLKKVKNTSIDSQSCEAPKRPPLQSTSPNKKAIPLRNTAANQENEDPQVHAECASVALDVLYKVDETTNDEPAARKREQGAILLLEKLITLEIQGSSHIQASKIHEQYWKRRRALPSALNKNRKDFADLHIMLLNESQRKSREDFNWICCFQSQILRLALFQGQTSITRDFVSAVALETLGSPAATILWGLEEGLILPDKAEGQLHTLSQALSKLASIGMNVQKPTISTEAFNLLVKAQLIKIKACELAAHNTDISAELWAAIYRAIRQSRDEEKHIDRVPYRMVVDSVKDIQEALKRSACSSEMPLKVQHLLVQLAEANHDIKGAVQRLNEMCSSANDDEKLFCSCKLVTLHLEQKLSSELIVPCVQNLLSNLSGYRSDSLTLAPERLVVLARLRKLCISSIVSADSKADHIDETGLNPLLLHIVFRMLDLSASQLVHVPDANEKLYQSLRLTILKNIEAVSDMEKYVMSNPETQLKAYLSSVDRCFNILEVLVDVEKQRLGNQDPSVVNALKLRLSNVYWRVHLCPTVQKSNEYSAIDLVSRSINALDGIPLPKLNQAALGPRLEKLASLHSAAGQSKCALAFLDRAVHHYIASEALADAVEAALSRRSCEVWTDSTTICFQLARVLRAHYAAITDQSPDHSITSRMLIPADIPDLHLAVLLEYQVLHVVGKESSLLITTDLVQIARKVLGLVPSQHYRVWRLRFLAQLLSRFLKGKVLEAQQKADFDTLVEYVTSEEACVESAFLQRFSLALTTLVCLQQWLLTGSTDHDALKTGLQSLEELTGECSTPDALAELIDDAHCLSDNLQACATMSLALGHTKTRILCLKLMINLINCDMPSKSKELDTAMVHLAQSYVRSGELTAAKKLLNHIISDTLSWSLKFDLLLTLAELYLSTSELGDAGETLRQAQAHYLMYHPPDSDEHRSNQLERDGLIARAAALTSHYAFRQGYIPLALRFARQATKISISIWATISKRMSASIHSKSDSTMATLADDLSHLNISSSRISDTTIAHGAVSWPYLDMHVRNLRHMAELMEHAGQYDDAMSFREKLQALSVSLRQSGGLAISPSMDLLRAKSHKSRDSVRQCSQTDLEGDQYKNSDSIAEALALAEVLIFDGYPKEAESTLQQISNRLDMAFTNVSSDSVQKGAASAVEMPVRSRVRGKTMSGAAKRGLKTKRPNTLKPLTEMVKAKRKTPNLVSFDLLSADDRRRALYLRLKISDSSNDAYHTVFEDLSAQSLGAEHLFYENYEKARWLIEQASTELRADSMTSLLLESVIAVPSNGHFPSRKGRVSFLQGGDDHNSSPKVGAPQGDSNQSISEKLLVARQIVQMLIQDRQHLCPTDVVHSLFKMGARIDLLLTTMNRPFSTSSASLILTTSQSKDIALERERMISQAETATKDRSALSQWPEIVTAYTASSRMIAPEQLCDLPKSWSIISLTLSEAGDEMVLSKISKEKSPFLIRLPLHRSNEGDGCEGLSYEDSKRELTDIINQANSSSHDSRGSSIKATRAQWHADREALDDRLRLLLEKIEDAWLGGFRGVMSNQLFGSKQIDQFRLMLDQCLDANLPSRQKTPASSSSRTRIHDHVLELFLGLSNSNESTLDDDIIDLLYFVADILQLNGERNAYDEINWDDMLVNVLDALRTTHQQKSHNSSDQVHTILVLDKELEAFPWEALPCLINHPVSRMPSLSAVFDRLALIRNQSPDASTFKISPINTTSNDQARGTYILNPSLDLQSTQSLLEPVLASNLPSFKAIINNAPTETDFTDYLTSDDILLYFGHGSGAQYIRGRTVRALDKCAVTWLMGCSSAKMTTCGKGESFGMPRWYMLGNSMAMVGCLWDVTDREIDRVSLSSMSEWGLIDGSDPRVQEALQKKSSRSRRKAPANMSDIKAQCESRGTAVESIRHKTVVEAVQKGREASVLRYLCGAAVVVYGVPVVLDK